MDSVARLIVVLWLMVNIFYINIFAKKKVNFLEDKIQWESLKNMVVTLVEVTAYRAL